LLTSIILAPRNDDSIAAILSVPFDSMIPCRFCTYMSLNLRLSNWLMCWQADWLKLKCCCWLREYVLKTKMWLRHWRFMRMSQALSNWCFCHNHQHQDDYL
jgi:hypothetical protein